MLKVELKECIDDLDLMAVNEYIKQLLNNVEYYNCYKSTSFIINQGDLLISNNNR